jgi:hypothetical protein
MTGGPISDSRIIAYDGQDVYFWARRRDKQNQSRPYRLSGRQFIERWSQHILPKGFTKSRCYGGFHNTKRAAYLEQCRQLLPAVSDQPPAAQVPTTPGEAPTVIAKRNCPRCESEMIRLGETVRESWGKILDGPNRPDWYHAFMGGHGRAYQSYRNGY